MIKDNSQIVAERALLHKAMFAPDPVPVGFTFCAAEWDGSDLHYDRPYSKKLWQELTLGDQQRYGEQEMAAIGAKVIVNVVAEGLTITLALPEGFNSKTFSASEIAWLKSSLEKAARKNMYWMALSRQHGWHK